MKCRGSVLTVFKQQCSICAVSDQSDIFCCKVITLFGSKSGAACVIRPLSSGSNINSASPFKVHQIAVPPKNINSTQESRYMCIPAYPAPRSGAKRRYRLDNTSDAGCSVHFH